MSDLSDVEEGRVLWLLEESASLDSETWKASGLHDGALNHPAIVIGQLGGEELKHYMILVCSKSYHSYLHYLPIEGRGSDVCRCRKGTGPNPTMLSYTESSLNAKHGHVYVGRAYLASTKMLRPLFEERDGKKFQIDDVSLRIVLEQAADAIKALKESEATRLLLQEHSKKERRVLREIEQAVPIDEDQRYGSISKERDKEGTSTFKIDQDPSNDEYQKRMKPNHCLTGLL